MPDRPWLGGPVARAGMVTTCRRPHLVGIAGAGMSSLATLLAAMGKSVSGSDAGGQDTLARLAGRGITVHGAHASDQVGRADLVIRSAAVPVDNPELAAARRRGLPIISHAEALGELMADRVGIGVAGTHGKSTTTALIAHILACAGRDPTLIGGAEAIDFGDSSHLGSGPELVAEADEYDRRLLALHPRLAVITGIELDHTDYFADLDEIRAVFRSFVKGMPEDGVVATFADEPNLDTLDLPRSRVRYGASPRADWRLLRYEATAGGGSRFVASDPNGTQHEYTLRPSGRHNAENALAGAVVGRLLEVPDATVARAVATFSGTRRRFETKLRNQRVWIVDDYAHHPTAVRVTLRAAREAHVGPIWAIFQPHTASRTAALLDQFAASFGEADHVVVTPIYRPTGREIEGAATSVTSEDLVARMRHPDARIVGSLDDALEAVRPALRSGAMVLTLGAGDVTTLSDRLTELALGRGSAT